MSGFALRPLVILGVAHGGKVTKITGRFDRLSRHGLLFYFYFLTSIILLGVGSCFLIEVCKNFNAAQMSEMWNRKGMG
jgi:hypothetical protein